MIRPVFDWKLKYSYSGKVEHALIYTSNYRGFEIVKEIMAKKRFGNFVNEKIIFYESTSKPVFLELSKLLVFVRNKARYKKKLRQNVNMH